MDAKDDGATTSESVVVGPIRYTGQAALQRDIDDFKAALKGVKVEEAFLPVAAVSSVIPDKKNEYYKSDDDLQVAVTSEQVKSAPNIEQHGEELSQADESALYHHFELNYTPPSIESGRRLARR